MSKRETYRIFGRQINTDISLPRLAGSNHTASQGKPEAETTYPPLQVTRADLPARPSAVDVPLEHVYTDPDGGFDAYLATDGDTVYWFDERIGTLRVRSGTEITVSPFSSAATSLVRQFVIGPGLRTAIGQQGDFVLHASAVAIDGQAVAFTGPSGRGKSTAAAACYAHGHPVLADDATVIPRDSTPAHVLPGASGLRLSEAARDALGLTEEDLVAPEPTGTITADQWPLAAIYLLEPGDQFKTSCLSASEGTFELLRAANTLSAAADQTILESQMATAGRLADTIAVKRLMRPRSLSKLDEFVTFVEADLEEEKRRTDPPGTE